MLEQVPVVVSWSLDVSCCLSRMVQALAKLLASRAAGNNVDNWHSFMIKPPYAVLVFMV